MDKLNSGNITKGTEAVNMHNPKAVMKGNYGKNEPIIESFGNKMEVYTTEEEYVAKQLLVLNSADWAMVWADADDNNLPNHLYLIYKKKVDDIW